MFTGKKVSIDLFTIFLNSNFKQTSLDEFIKDYDKNKNETLFVLQFHHADLSNKQFKVLVEVIDFLKNKEKRIFVTPAEFFKISKNGDL